MEFASTNTNTSTFEGVGGLTQPSPSHQRQKSLEDIVYSNDINDRVRVKKMSSNHARQLSVATLVAHNEQLQQALEFEENETIRLERLAKDMRGRLERSTQEQSRLEQDVVNRDNQIELLTRQLKDMKRAKQELENDFSQEQMNYMNEKQQWLDKEAEYEERLSEKNNIKNLQIRVPSASSTGSQDTMAASVVQSPAPPPTPTKDQFKAMERMKSELDVTKQQLELVSKEYSLRHESVKQEMQQIKELNIRLQEENEGFQVLLAQKTVMGEFSLAKELESISMNEEDEDEHENGNDNENDSDKENDNENENGANGMTTQEKRKLYDLQFEAKSLKNHNRALKLSIERLVQRLLEFKEFESVVEDSQQDITQRSISFFTRRVSRQESREAAQRNSSATLDVPKRRSRRPSTLNDDYYLTSPGSATSSVFQFPPGGRAQNRALKPASTWSSLIFNLPSNQNTDDSGIDSPISTGSTNTNVSGNDMVMATASASSASSIDSCNTSIVDKPRPPLTNSQKKLRPLRLPQSSTEQPQTSTATTTTNAEPSPSSSTWSFGFGAHS